MKTVVAEPAWVPPTLFVGFPVLGAGAGLLILALAHWWDSLEWKLLRAPAVVISSIPQPWATIGAVVVGGLAGLIVAFIAVHESLSVTIDDERVLLDRKGATRGFDRSDVAAVFLDGKQLVLLGFDTKELARDQSDLNATRLRDAFVTHGYPWREADPYRAEFRRWVEDTPDLPPGANVLLKARAIALAKAESDDAAELRGELARLGVVVRDEKKRQFWRITAPQSGA